MALGERKTHFRVILAMVKIWDGISGFGTTNAKIYTGTINGQSYYDDLETKLNRSMAKFPKTKMVYQENFVACHTSNTVKD